MTTRGWVATKVKLVVVGALVVGAPMAGCSDGEPDFTEGAGQAGEASGAMGGDGNGGSAQHAGSAGKAGGGGKAGSGSAGSGAAGSMSEGGAGSPSMAGQSMGGAPIVGEGGIGGEGGNGGEAGEGGAPDTSCPSGSYALVGATGCFECPGPMYVTFPSTCAMLEQSSGATPKHRYDATTHVVRLKAGPGLPMPSSWYAYDTAATFDTPEHKAACTAQVGYSVDGPDYVADLSAVSACVGIKDITLLDLAASYGCAHGVTSSTYIFVNFEQPEQFFVECHSPYLGVPIMFGGHVPFPRPARFDVTTASAVKDNETGLTWEQRAAGDYPSLSEPAAATHCSALSHAGFDDWRLPSASELFTLVKLESDGTANLHDLTIFPASPDVAFWTSSASPKIAAGSGYVINFGSFYKNNGQVIPPMPLQDGNAQVDEHRVRCVRGGASPAQRYTSNANGTVSDGVTGHVWERKPTVAGAAAIDAQNYCRELALAGGGWRVPTVRELTSIIDFDGGPFLNSAFEKATGAGNIYWSSSPFFAENHVGWIVDFDWAALGPAGDDPAQAAVRCVR